MKRVLFSVIVFCMILISSVIAHAQYMPTTLDYVKPKSWSQYQFTYAAWTDPTGNPNPYHSFFGWVNKRCLVTGVWLQNGQWYAMLNIPGTDYFVAWPVNYVTILPAKTTDLLIKVN